MWGATLPGVVAGQDVERDTLDDPALRMPHMRELTVVPAVSTTGTLSRADGGRAAMPVTPALGDVDLEWYRDQFRWRFPLSGDAYPSDSIARLLAGHARAWRDRFSGDAPSGPGATTWQLVPLAKVAARAGDDSLARRLIETRLAQLQKSPAEQSYVLIEAIETFADTALDATRLARTVPWAESYTARLHALPASGYRMTNDSASVLYRQVRAEHALVLAYDVLGVPDQVLAHVHRLFAVAVPISVRERGGALSDDFPILQVYRAIWASPDAKRQQKGMDSLIVATGMDGAESAVRWMDMYHTRAPVIQYHRWLNTADTSYSTSPRRLDLADGTIRVLAFGRYDSLLPYALARVARQFPTGVQAVFVTHTRGAIGLDLASPQDETAWMQDFFARRRHITTVPIAVWAPGKVPTKVPPGEGMLPPPSPVDEAYQAGMLFRICVLVDGSGRVAGWYDVASRKGEAALVHDIAALRTAAPASQPHAASTSAP